MFYFFVCIFYVLAAPWGPGPDLPLVMSFEQWKKHFVPSGYESSLEDQRRRKIYEETVALILKENAKNTGVTLGVNQFAAMTSEEFKNTILMKPSTMNDTRKDLEVVHIEEDARDFVDWREEGVVGPVKDQGHCGSCWAFATTGAFESCVAIQTGRLYSYSEQQLVSCCTDNYYCWGCDGSRPDIAFEYIWKSGGLTTESNYPYRSGSSGTNLECSPEKAAHKFAKGRSVAIKGNSDAQFTAAISRGPVTVTIGSQVSTFMWYRSGIIRTPCNIPVDHAIVAIGYTDDYYIVRNSWGRTWGYGGYGFIKRVKGDTTGGWCHILKYITQPVQCELVGTPPSPSPVFIPTTKPTRAPAPHQNYGDPALGCRNREEIVNITYGSSSYHRKWYCGQECSTVEDCPPIPSHIKAATVKCQYMDTTVSKKYCAATCDYKASMKVPDSTAYCDPDAYGNRTTDLNLGNWCDQSIKGDDNSGVCLWWGKLAHTYPPTTSGKLIHSTLNDTRHGF